MSDQIQKSMCDQEPMAEIMPNVITAMASLLQRVSETNDDLSHPFREHQRISAFSALTKPSISIRSYMERIFKYPNCSDSCYIVAYIYLDRFIPIDSFNVQRLIITSFLVSAKFIDDLCYNNAYDAKVGGITTEEINLLELDFLFECDYFYLQRLFFFTTKRDGYEDDVLSAFRTFFCGQKF